MLLVIVGGEQKALEFGSVHDLPANATHVISLVITNVQLCIYFCFIYSLINACVMKNWMSWVLRKFVRIFFSVVGLLKC